MRSYLIALTGLMLFAGHAAQAKVDVVVDKNNQMMTVSVDGVTKYHWPVSTGIPSRETPNGTFHAFRMEASHFSKEFDDAPMPHSIFFTKVGHAIHGTESEGRLGTPVSHGCVRLSRANAATLYALVEQQGVLNTTVTLTGSAAIALARHPNNAVARRAPAPAENPDEQYASVAGEPVVITPPAQTYGSNFFGNNQGYAQQRQDDGYIYPADGSSDRQIYPAPRSSHRTYDAQAYQQQPRQYYDNQGYVPPPPGYYNQQPQQYYQPRGYYQ